MYKIISRSNSQISFNFLPLALSRDSAVIVVTRHLAGQFGFRIPEEAKIFICSKSSTLIPPPPPLSFPMNGGAISWA